MDVQKKEIKASLAALVAAGSIKLDGKPYRLSRALTDADRVKNRKAQRADRAAATIPRRPDSPRQLMLKLEYCKPVNAQAVSTSPDWINEVKHDGYRGQIVRYGKESGCSQRAG